MLDVIIRSEVNYFSGDFHWVAVFPGEPANYGKLQYMSFVIKKGKIQTIEAFGEMTLSWYYLRTQHVKPTVLDSYGVYDALRKWYEEDGVKLRFRQKLPRKFNWK